MIKFVKDLLKLLFCKKERLAIEAKYLLVHNQLKAAQKLNPPEALVAQFNILSSLSDNRSTIEQEISAFNGVDDRKLEYLTQIKHCLVGIRSPHGTNRTTSGQMVTNDNIYLGNIFGLPTLPLTAWLNCKDAPPKGIGPSTTVDWTKSNDFNVILNHQIIPYLDGFKHITQLALEIGGNSTENRVSAFPGTRTT